MAGNPAGNQAPPSIPKRLPGEKVALPLNNEDTIYAEIRDLSIEKLGTGSHDVFLIPLLHYRRLQSPHHASC
jgi:hypothetical protein